VRVLSIEVFCLAALNILEQQQPSPLEEDLSFTSCQCSLIKEGMINAFLRPMSVKSKAHPYFNTSNGVPIILYLLKTF
jgi:hypothetical protein